MKDVSPALRARAYRLFATLIERGVTPDLRPILADLAPLAEHLDELGSPDEAAARHYRFFNHEVQPVGSVFLERSGRVGGEVTRAAAVVAGEVEGSAGLPADHLVIALRALARVTSADEAVRVDADQASRGLAHRAPRGTGADEAARTDARERRAARGRRLLDGHLLWWLPLWSATVARHADPFWRAAVGLLVDAVLDHAAALPVAVDPDPPFGLAVAVEGPLVGSDGPTGLDAVADYVATPVRSGIFLTPVELRRLSRDAGAPAGFGDRRRVLRNLLLSAARYGALPSVAEGVFRVLEEQEREIEARVPAELAGYLAPWRVRWAILHGLLDRLSTGGAGARPDGPMGGRMETSRDEEDE